MGYAPIAVTASRTLGNYEAGTVVVVNAAAGLTLTLPASSGNGTEYEIFIGTTVTSNSVIIQVANSSDVMAGQAIMATDNASDVVISFETASTSDTITMNGTTKGGILGDRIRLRDVATNVWSVLMTGSATGTEVTPFSAAV